MIRRCAVFGCDNTDEVSLSHRFPDNKTLAQAWKDSLKLQEFPIELLQSKFIVCKNHFCNRDYSNEEKLLATAIPKLNDSANCNEAQIQELIQVDEVNSSANATDCVSMQIVGPTLEAMALLHPPSHNMRSSCNSTSSTNYTGYSHDDICILETNASHYGMDSFESQRDCVLMQSLDVPDFAVLNAESGCKYSLAKRESTFDESTEIIYAHSESRKKQSHAISSTDSDVEILMSEEIIDSDWSSANVGIIELKSTNSEAEEENIEHISCGNEANIPNTKFQESTAHDITEENFSLNSGDLYEQLSRTQLINIIKEQAAKIRGIETSLSRYQLAQRKLFQHIEALRLEFEGDFNN